MDVGDDRHAGVARRCTGSASASGMPGHGHAHDLAAGVDQALDLREGGVDVVRLGRGHRLDDDGRAAADRDAADADLPSGWPSRGSLSGRIVTPCRRDRRRAACAALGTAEIGRCRCCSPTRNNISISAMPTTETRSKITRAGSAGGAPSRCRANRMCPPSSGRNGSRLKIASDSEMNASSRRVVPGRDGVGRALDDADGRRQLVAALGRHHALQALDRALGDEPRLLERTARGRRAGRSASCRCAPPRAGCRTGSGCPSR